MTRETIVFLIGLLVIIVPHLGIPNDWKEYFFIGVGLLLMVIGYSLRRATYLRSIEHSAEERRADSFVEGGHNSA